MAEPESIRDLFHVVRRVERTLDESALTLPHSIDAEKLVLGAILVQNDAFDQAAELLDSRDFFRDAHRRIFDKMVTLAERDQGIGVGALKEELRRSDELEEVGGQAYLSSLVDGLPPSANVEHYARVVKEKATLRSLIHYANRVLADAYQGEEDAALILDSADKAIFNIVEDSLREGLVPARELVQNSFAIIEKLQIDRGKLTGVPTGYADFDEITAGLQPSDLVLVAGGPSTGKTTFVLNIAREVSTKSDMTVGFFSLDISKEQLFMRMLTSEAGISAHDFRRGYLDEEDYRPLSIALGTLAEARLFFCDTAMKGVLEMRAKARRLMAEYGLHLLIIDSIAGMQGGGGFDTRLQELTYVVRSIKSLASELRIPVLAVWPLDNIPSAYAGGVTGLGDDEFRTIQRDADLVAILRPDDDPDPKSGQRAVVSVTLTKHRNGPTGQFRLLFDRTTLRFESLHLPRPADPAHMGRTTPDDIAAVDPEVVRLAQDVAHVFDNLTSRIEVVCTHVDQVMQRLDKQRLDIEQIKGGAENVQH